MKVIIVAVFVLLQSIAWTQSVEPVSGLSLISTETTSSPQDSIDLSLSMELPEHVQLMGYVLSNESTSQVVHEDIIDVGRDSDEAGTEFTTDGNTLTLLLGSFPANEVFSIEVYAMDYSGTKSSSQFVSTSDQP